MDAKRFDAIAKAWVSVPRRRLLGGVAAGTLGSILGLAKRGASALSCQEGSDCPAGHVCKNRTCVATCPEAGTCNTGFPHGCQNSANCFCGKKPGGGGLCVEVDMACTELKRCRKQGNCPFGTVCAAGCCSPKFVCQPPCGSVLPSATGADAASSRGEGRAVSGQPSR